MNKLALTHLLLALTTAVFSAEIEISLPTKNRHSTIYIAAARSGEHELEDLVNYVISEDFTLDGRGKIFEKNTTFLSFEKTKGENLYSNEIWHTHKIDYVIFPNLSEKKLTINLFNVRKSTIKTLSEITLGCNRDKNVHILHKASDFLMEQIYGSPGIASKRILYSFKPFRKEVDETTSSWTSEIYETDYLGVINRQVTKEHSYLINPEFTKQRALSSHYEFVYVTYKLGQPQIYLGKSDGSDPKPFIKLCGNQLLPKISFDGRYICFISDASGKSDVFIQKIDEYNQVSGKPIQVYSAAKQTSASPCLSPDNKLLAFVSDKTGDAKVYIANIEETLVSRKSPQLEKVKSPCSECTAPCFSPDGTKIAFSGKINGRRQIFLYDIKQKNAQQLTTGSEDKENPCFGSDGRHILYNTTSPNTEIFILSIDQNKVRKLTKGSGEKHYPAFEK